MINVKNNFTNCGVDKVQSFPCIFRNTYGLYQFADISEFISRYAGFKQKKKLY